MTGEPLHEIVAYSRFLECQDRRRKIAAALSRFDQPHTIADRVDEGERQIGGIIIPDSASRRLRGKDFPPSK